jgi:hypothetical protein
LQIHSNINEKNNFKISKKKKPIFPNFSTHLQTMTMITRRQQKMRNTHNAFKQGAQTRRQTAGKQRYAIADYKQPSGIREPRPCRVSSTLVGSARTVITNRKDCCTANDLPSHSRSESSSGSSDFGSSTCKKVFPKGTIDLATIDSNLDSVGKANMMTRPSSVGTQKKATFFSQRKFYWVL